MPQWNGVIDCKVPIVEPDNRLAYTRSSMGLNTTVTWTPAESGTPVRMKQSGFGPEEERRGTPRRTRIVRRQGEVFSTLGLPLKSIPWPLLAMNGRSLPHLSL
jgi:hypothetical protein